MSKAVNLCWDNMFDKVRRDFKADMTNVSEQEWFQRCPSVVVRRHRVVSRRRLVDTFA